VFFPGRRRQYFNPARDYACERWEQEEDANAEWQEDKGWLNDLPTDARKRNFYFRESRKVLEYAQTGDGQWYARKISAEYQSGRGTVQRMIFIFVDVSREIADKLLDPSSIDSEKAFRSREKGG
jgi:hypothetical protein